MVSWKTGMGAVVLAVALSPALPGCTEPEPLYCDAEHPCSQVGYSCDYSRRTCVAHGDSDQGGVLDTGVADEGSDRAAPDAVADQAAQPDAQAGTDSAPIEAGSVDAAGGSDL